MNEKVRRSKSQLYALSLFHFLLFVLSFSITRPKKMRMIFEMSSIRILCHLLLNYELSTKRRISTKIIHLKLRQVISMLSLRFAKVSFQLDSLVQSIYPKEKYVPVLEKTIHDLHPFFVSLPAVGPIHPLDVTDSLLAFRARGEQHAIPIAIPYPVPHPTRSTAWNVAFKAPVRLNVVGSWATKTAFKRPEKNWFVVDLAVEMPSV